MHVSINIGWFLVAALLVWAAYEHGYNAGLEYARKVVNEVFDEADEAETR